MEYRRKCNVCGKIWCFTDKDEKENLKNTAMAGLNALGQIGAALGGTIFHSAYFGNQTNSYENKVVDYDRCPSCNSTNYSTYTNLVENVAVNNNQVTFSENREREVLKKQWLDQGLIDREDYDTMTDEQFDILKEEFELLDKEFDDFF